MGAFVAALNWAINSVNSLIQQATEHPIPFFSVIALFAFFKWRKDYAMAKTFLLAQSGYGVIDGDFSRGKTRFLTIMAEEAKQIGMIVLCNFYNKNEDVRWNSKADLIRLMTDMWKIGEYQNFDIEEMKQAYASEGKKRVKEKIKMISDIRRKYPNIPRNGFHTKFLLLSDESQNIFFNRDSQGNFAGENKPLLKLLHQIRHFNARGLFALTDAAEFDRKFRRISSFYITFQEAFSDWFVKYDVFQFTTDKENNLDLEKASRLTKTSVYKVNGYSLNKVVAKLETLLKRRIPYRFKQLGFFSKFNCDPDYDVYESEQLMRYLNSYYAQNPDMAFENASA